MVTLVLSCNVRSGLLMTAVFDSRPATFQSLAISTSRHSLATLHHSLDTPLRNSHLFNRLHTLCKTWGGGGIPDSFPQWNSPSLTSLQPERNLALSVAFTMTYATSARPLRG